MKYYIQYRRISKIYASGQKEMKFWKELKLEYEQLFLLSIDFCPYFYYIIIKIYHHCY